MITNDKVTEIFCIIDEFDKNLSAELTKNLRLPSHNSDGKRYRNRKGRLSESEIMTILVCYHFGTYRNFKEYYLNWVKGVMRQDFPDGVSYNRFVELMPRVFFKMMLFMKLYAFGGKVTQLCPFWPNNFAPTGSNMIDPFGQNNINHLM
ncbi:hypothetical protein JN06_02133 [Bacteroides zoogleoformans]|nr:hypothetical protein JN06_02133 [Bacteroides zoogleoformans]